MKIPKLVTLTLTVVVVADQGATDEEIVELARPKFQGVLSQEHILEYITEIEDDTEVMQ